MPLPLLVVDDNQYACATLARLLRTRGYRADVALEAFSALRLVEQNPYALAILDYELPGMNGVELFRRIRNLQPDLPGIFVTGFTTIDVVFPAVEAGIRRILAKPLDFAELWPIIEQHAGAPA